VSAGRRILIVDDDQSVVRTTARILKLEGYEVQTAANAQMGLCAAELNHPDAIIVDLRMPLVDGLEFLRRLRSLSEQRATPVAIVTGDYFLDEAVASELAALGARVKYKPLFTEDLISLARSLLEVTN
jgi:DNA-binding response OmpR family regulator